MKERPILFSAEMVRATLDDRKTQTRRIIRFRVATDDPMCHSVWLCWQGGSGQVPRGRREHEWQDGDALIRCPFGYVGDRLWVREAWSGDDETAIWYAAESTYPDSVIRKWKPSSHMPRWASRITLEITAVRAERLQAISESDAKAEGVTVLNGVTAGYLSKAEVASIGPNSFVRGFANLWNKINGKHASWNSNPWVWCLEFRVVKP